MSDGMGIIHFPFGGQRVFVKWPKKIKYNFIAGHFRVYHPVKDTLKCISLNFFEKNPKNKKVTSVSN